MPAFRLLHTSDWHLGALFHDQARDQEEQRALDGVVALAQQEAVDAVVVAGDVFDSVNPSAAAQARYYHTLVRLVKDAGVGCVLLIGGNHDQGLRLDGPRAVLGTLRVHVRGQLLSESDPADVVVPIQGRRGDTVGWAALVPYLRDTDVASIPLGVSAQVLADRQAEALTARLAAVRQALVAQAQGLPMVAVTHTFAAGGQIGSTERPVYAEDVVGRLSRADISPLGNGCAYVALGHLHRSQRVSGQDHWRYCGSLLPMAMDETSSARQVLLADIPADGGPAQVRGVPLVGGRRYARLQGDIPTIHGTIAGLPEAVPTELEPWCDVTLNLATADPGLVRELETRIAARGWRALAVRRQAVAATASVWTTGSAPEHADLHQLTPQEVFLEVAKAQGTELTPELIEDFAQLLAGVTSRDGS